MKSIKESILSTLLPTLIEVDRSGRNLVAVFAKGYRAIVSECTQYDTYTINVTQNDHLVATHTILTEGEVLDVLQTFGSYN